LKEVLHGSGERREWRFAGEERGNKRDVKDDD
jgi:hypothetical protein